MKKFILSLAEQFPKLAQFYRNSRDQLDRNQPAKDTPWGFKFAGHEEMATGTFEPNETGLVRNLLQDVDILVNIGANVGYYCCHALSLGKPVIAVEPITRNLHYLMRNIVENGWAKQVEIFPVALGSQSDILKIWGGGTGASLIKGWAGIPESYVTQVPVMTLDRILCTSLQGKQAMILADVEGAEYAMLQGALTTLQNKPKPIWMIEIGSTSHQPKGIKVNPHLIPTFELFFKYGYTAKTADLEQMVVDMQMLRSAAKGESELPSHNFLFQ